MKGNKYKFLFCLYLFFNTFPIRGFAIITSIYNNNAQFLAEKIFSGSGIRISNARLKGSSLSSGIFSGTSSISLQDGILLSTGDILQAVGINNSGSTTTPLGTDGDIDINNYTLAKSFDATVLEFDFITISDTIKFDFVFASEEYLEFICESYNDIFLALLSGSDIIGNINIATIPSTNEFISVNNIQPGRTICPSKNNEYYVDNQTPPGTSIQFDGFTTTINAWAKITPCKTYHLKLVIADVGDAGYDSGIFIKGKNYQGKVPEIFDTQEKKICLHDTLLLQAIDSIGYNYLWSTGDTTNNIKVDSSGLFWLEINNGLACTLRDSINIIEIAQVKANSSPPQTICTNDSLTLYASGGKFYNWLGGNGLKENFTNSVKTIPLKSFSYTVYVSDECTADTTYSKVNLLNCHVFIANGFTPNNDGINDKICINQEGLLEGRFIIFNRWGRKVYDNKDITACWTGKSLLNGVYAYYFQGQLINSKIIRKKGNITLLR